MKSTKQIARVEPQKPRLLIVSGTEPYAPGIDELAPPVRGADRAVRFDRDAPTRPDDGARADRETTRVRRLAPTQAEMPAVRDTSPPPSDAGRYSLIVHGLRLRRSRR